MIKTPSRLLRITIVALILPPCASGGPSKATRVLNFRIRASTVEASVLVGNTSLEEPLAQIGSPLSYRSGVRCRKHSTRVAITRLATKLALDDAAQVIPDAKGLADAVYLWRANRPTRVTSSLNYRLVQAGLAVATPYSGTYIKQFQRAERTARRKHLDIWSHCNLSAH